MNQVQSDAKVTINFDAVSEDFVFPSQAPLGQTLAIDLEEPFWRRWWRRRITSEEAASSLQALIVQEFSPIISELVSINKRELASEIDYSSLQLSINGTNLVQSLKNQKLTYSIAKPVPLRTARPGAAQDDSDRQQMLAPTTRPVGSRHWEQRFEHAENQYQRTDVLVRELGSLTEDCQALLG